MRRRLNALRHSFGYGATSFVLVLSLVTAAVPFILSQEVDAAPNTSYTATGFGGLTWGVDRQLPTGGWTQSGNSLTLNVDGDMTPPSSFYSYEGVKATLPSGVTSVSADLYVDPAWQDKDVIVGMWGRVQTTTPTGDGNYDNAWPTLEFYKQGEFAAVDVWNTLDGNIYGETTVAYGSTVNLEIAVNPVDGTFVYYLNGAPIFTSPNAYNLDGSEIAAHPTWPTSIAYTKLSEVIFNNKNWGQDYSVQWSNLRVGRQNTVAPTGLQFVKAAATVASGTVLNNKNGVALQWNRVTNANRYRIVIAHPDGTTATWEPSSTASWNPAVWTFQLNRSAYTDGNDRSGYFGERGQGVYTYTVQARDATTNVWSPASASMTLAYDTVAPVIQASPDANTMVNGTKTFVIDQTELNPGTLYVEYMEKDAGGIWRKKQGQQFGAVNTASLVVDTTSWSDGLHQIKVSSKDKAGNSAGYSFTVTVDNTAPAAPAIVNGNVFVKIGQANKVLAWTHSGLDAVTYQYREYTSYANAVADTAVWTKNISAPTLSTSDTASLTSTVLYWRVVAIDALGNRSALSDIGKITIDRNAPTSTNDLAGLVRGTVTTTQTVSDNFTPVSGKLRIWKLKADGTSDDTKFYAIGNVNVNALNQVEYSFNTLTKLYGDGQYIAKFTATDEAGNASVSQQYFTLDNTSPEFSVKAASIGSGTLYRSLSLALSDAGMIDKVAINSVETDLVNGVTVDLDGITAGNYGAVEGDNTIVMYDVAGNSTTYTFTIDTTAPTVPTLLAPADMTVTNGAPQLAWSHSAPSDVTGSVLRQYADQALTSLISETAVLGTTYNLAANLNSTIWWQVAAVDGLGNQSSFSAARKLTIDNTAPVVTFEDYTVLGNVMTPIMTTNDELATYSWEYVSGPEISGVVPNPEDNVLVSDYAALAPDFTVLSDGIYTYQLTVTDQAGNESQLLFIFVYETPVTEEAPSELVPVITPVAQTPTTGTGFTNVAVLGQATQDAEELAIPAAEEVKGATTEQTATTDTTNEGKIFGLFWYWWALIAAAAVALAWWLMTLLRRRQAQ